MSYEAEDTKQKLIEAAREQFYKKGISNTTLEKITKQAFVQPSCYPANTTNLQSAL